MKITILLASLLICCNIFAQNYRTIKSDAEFYYISTGTNYGDINAIKIDSTKIIGNDTILYNFRSMRNSVHGDTCGNLFGPSWIGNKVVLKPDGYNLFFNKVNDTIKINTRAPLNATWVFYKFPTNYYIEAQVKEVDTANFLGITDSIKVIGFLLKDINGDTVDYFPTDMVISKNYGFIRMPDFYEFPYDSITDVTSTNDPNTDYYLPDYNIVGKTNPTVGTVNFKAKDIYNFNIGDEFHTEQMYTVIGPGTKSITNLIKTIVSKTESPNHDTIVYSIKRCGRMESWTVQTDHAFTYYNDTIINTYVFPLNQYNPLDELPNKTFYFNNFYDYYDLRASCYSRATKWHPGYMAFESGGNGCYYMNGTIPPMMTYYYIDGCGGGYYNQDDWMFNEYNHLSLVYYKKGTETCGTPYNCGTLLNTKELNKEQIVLLLYPNPIETISCLEVKNINESIKLINLYNSIGEMIRTDNVVNSNKAYIRKGELVKGIYFYRIETESGKSLSGKLIVD
ncbi:MAG: T9SS type A sorting domain-containing protein [Bacteroidia bacterium]|nr:T9SS type A sorting domain-containing protein [Bacteroidia bacterium]